MTLILCFWHIFFDLCNRLLKLLFLRIYLTLTRDIPYKVRQQNLPALWNAVVRKTTQPGFEEYGDVFLVAVFDHLAVSNGGICVGITSGEIQEKSVIQAMEIWERDVDMRYVPRGRLEYRVESSWRV